MSRDQMTDIAVKGLSGAGFFFVLQYYVLEASLQTALFWGTALGIGAGLLAWSQHTRRR